MRKSHQTIRHGLLALMLLSQTGQRSHAINALSREFFGITAVTNAHPELTGKGMSVGVCDVGLDVTHPALGWTNGVGDYQQWYTSSDPIPRLREKNPRILSAYKPDSAYPTEMAVHHGQEKLWPRIPIGNNNTVGAALHGTEVTGVIAAVNEGTNNHGVLPETKIIFSDGSQFDSVLAQILDGNPDHTAALNRSFVNSSYVRPDVKANAGVSTVNATGNFIQGAHFYGNSLGTRLAVHGLSPNVKTVRWLESVGYDVVAGGLFLNPDGTGEMKVGYDTTWCTGSHRNQETLITQFYWIHTLGLDGTDEIASCGSSYSAPMTAGLYTLIQQAYENTHNGDWLSQEQLTRIVRRSARFVDDHDMGFRLPVIYAATAVELARTYNGDPGFEPNFTDTFEEEARVNPATDDKPYYPNPNRFRPEFRYSATNAPPNNTVIYSKAEYTAPTVVSNAMEFKGNTGLGEANVAIRNGWGDLARADLSRSGKTLSMSFDYNSLVGASGAASNEFFVGIKEMYGSDQFMSEDRMGDHESHGRLAFRFRTSESTGQTLIEALRCSVAPTFHTNGFWSSPDGRWDAQPLASAVVGDLTGDNYPTVRAVFTSARIQLFINNVSIIDVPHTASSTVLSRSTPYLHFRNHAPNQVQRVKNFSVATTTAVAPHISMKPGRGTALEGLRDAPAGAGFVVIVSDVVRNTPLTVNYTVSGSAQNGVDFDQLSGSVTIPAGVATVDVKVRPITDTVDEGSESLTIQLAPGGGYTLGDSISQSLIVQDYTDADKDGLPNTAEDLNGNGNLTDDDTDYDMLPNYADNDDDNDGIPTAEEDTNGNGIYTDDDSDEDGIPNYLDPDPANFDSFYDSLTVVGTLNDWNQNANNMSLINHHIWRGDLGLTNDPGQAIKFVANHDWAHNWGKTSQQNTSLPINDTADKGDHPDIAIANRLYGGYRFIFDENSGGFLITCITDADNDGMPNAWENLYGLDSETANQNENPDGDLYTNIEEFQNGTDPVVWTAPDSLHDSMTVAGSFNGWNAGANNMSLTDHYVWQWDTAFINEPESEHAFKFTAGGNWSLNWGENEQFSTSLPVQGIADPGSGPNIRIDGPLNGNYRFTFYESEESGTAALYYYVEKRPDPDTDGDGMPDYWEKNYGLDWLTPNAFDNQDGDQWGNLEEFTFGSNPSLEDTDSDGFVDGEDSDDQVPAFKQVRVSPSIQGSVDRDWCISCPTGTYSFIYDRVFWITGYHQPHTYKSYLQFDLSELPAGADIQHAVLLHQDYGSPSTPIEFKLSPMGSLDPSVSASAAADAYWYMSTASVDTVTGDYPRGSGGHEAHVLNATLQSDIFSSPDRSRWGLGISGVPAGSYETLRGSVSNIQLIVSYIHHESSFDSISVAGTFNQWNAGANNMGLVDDFIWEWETTFTNVVFPKFKFTANGAWAVNWGDHDQGTTSIPMEGYLDIGSQTDITIAATLNGTYRFHFDEFSGFYRVEKIGGPEVEWVGDVFQWPFNGSVTSSDDLWVNTESYPAGKAETVKLFYSEDNGSTWASVDMISGLPTGANDTWHYNLGQFPAGQLVLYYVSAYDAAGHSVTENYGGLNYRANVGSDGTSLQWVGNVAQWPPFGQVNSTDDLWINIESYAVGAAKSARVVYSTDGGAVWHEETMNPAGISGNNDWWSANLGRFSSGTTVHYAVELIDGKGQAWWDSNFSSNYMTTVN